MREITIEFARRDDCLDRMVPSDLRAVVSERDHLRNRINQLEKELTDLEKEIRGDEFLRENLLRGGDS